MSDRARRLSRIAEALNLPAETFMNVAGRGGEDLASVEESVELLEAFQKIGDRQARRRCLSYVKAAAERSSESA